MKEACEAVGLPRATYYYALRPAVPAAQRHSPRRLSDAERAEVLEVLVSERFCDLSPREVWAILLDERRRSIYRKSGWRTFDVYFSY